MNQIKYIDYKPGYKTDHSLLEFSFNVATEQRGHGYWKFNARLLHDKDFVEQVNYILDNVEASQLNPHEKWDTLKEKIQTVAIKRAKVIAHKNRENFDNLTKQVLECERSVDIDHRNGTKYIEYLNAKVQLLEELVQQQTNAAKFRSKCNTALAFEHSSKYFFALEKNNYNKKVMSQIKNSEGKIISKGSEVLHEQEKFYAKLYKSNESVTFNLQNNGKIYVDCLGNQVH